MFGTLPLSEGLLALLPLVLLTLLTLAAALVDWFRDRGA